MRRLRLTVRFLPGLGNVARIEGAGLNEVGSRDGRGVGLFRRIAMALVGIGAVVTFGRGPACKVGASAVGSHGPRRNAGEVTVDG